MAHELINAYLDHLRMLERSPRTIEDRGEILRRMHEDLPMGLDLATADEIGGWLYRPGWSKQTKATYYGAVRGFFLWATDPRNPELDFDPTEYLERPRVPAGVPRPATDEQVAQILDRAGQPFLFWATLAAYQGLRCCEISALDREDITEQDTYLRGKGDKVRVVPTDPDVWNMVRGLPSGPVTVDRHGRRSTAHHISQRAGDHFDRVLGISVTLHQLRHWYATRTLEACGNLRVVQELLGHASPNTTAVYTRVSDRQRREAVRALPRFGAAAVGGAARIREAAR